MPTRPPHRRRAAPGRPRADPQAFREFYERYAVWMRSWFQRQTGSETAALDLTAETFAQAWRSLRRFKDMADGSAAPWLFGIARNLLRQYHKHNRIETAARARLGLPIDWEGTEAYDAVDERMRRRPLEPALQDGGPRAARPTSARALELRVVQQLPLRRGRRPPGLLDQRRAPARVPRAARADRRAAGARMHEAPAAARAGRARRPAGGRRAPRARPPPHAPPACPQRRSPALAVALPLVVGALGDRSTAAAAARPRPAPICARAHRACGQPTTSRRAPAPPRARPTRTSCPAHRPAEGAEMSMLPSEDTRAAERARCVTLIRESLAVLSSKWCGRRAARARRGPRRYHEILAELDPISEKVLTQTLRTMERDGLIARHVHAEVPPRVEYELTRLGALDGRPDEGARHAGPWPTARASRPRASATTRSTAEPARRRPSTGPRPTPAPSWPVHAQTPDVQAPDERPAGPVGPEADPGARDGQLGQRGHPVRGAGAAAPACVRRRRRSKPTSSRVEPT